MPDNDIVLPKWSHSSMAHTLCPGLVEVIEFGGCPDDYCPERPPIDDTRIAETTVITFSELLSVVIHVHHSKGVGGGGASSLPSPRPAPTTFLLVELEILLVLKSN
jgi:hypothetical protein